VIAAGANVLLYAGMGADGHLTIPQGVASSWEALDARGKR
jgi:hypothetical protein